MANFRPLPERDWLIEHLRYNPDTGIFLRAKAGQGISSNYVAGTKVYRKDTGEPKEIVIYVGGHSYKAHRLAWRIMTGEDPMHLSIDHINRMPFDNRISNLRLADNSLQSRNRRAFGASPYKGVSFNKQMQKWRAGYRGGGRWIRVGHFDTEEEAAAAVAQYFIH
jgi:hypothetical protein